MKLTKKIAVSYYRTKFRCLGLIAPSKAASSAFKLFCTPPSGKIKPTVPAIFDKADSVSLKIENNITMRGWQWLPQGKIDKTVLIMHGFDSYCFRFEKYIRPLLREGFSILAFDAPGHGRSDGKTIHSLQYKNAVHCIEKKFGELYGIIGHSMGGLAASLASEQMPHLKKLVLIAPAVEIKRPINNFSTKLALPKRVKDRMYNLIVKLAKNPVSYFEVGRAIEKISTPTLWLHDEEDIVCPMEDVAPVKESCLPHVTFKISKGLGHSNIYRDAQSVKTIVDFLKVEPCLA